MNKTEKIPFLDLITPHEELKDELCASFENALEKGAFVGGAAVESFEQDFAAFCDTATLRRRRQRHRCAALRHHGRRA